MQILCSRLSRDPQFPNAHLSRPITVSPIQSYWEREDHDGGDKRHPWPFQGKPVPCGDCRPPNPDGGSPIHEPGPGEVLLHIKVTGICGSDVHFWKHGRIGDLTIDGDCILGHEPAVCPPSARNVTFDSAALLEPLSVAMHALRITPITMGTPVAVFGAGPIGLLTMAVARASGAYPIVISDIDENRLAFAKAFEPNCRTYKVDPVDSPEQSAAKVRDLFERKGWESSAGRTEYDMPNVVLECTGIESSIATAAFTVRRGGSINVVGVSSRPSINNIPFMHMSLAEIQLRFINRYHDTWPAALRALEGGLIDPTKVDGLVTHRFKLEDAIDAMNLVAGITKPAPGERVVKVQIVDELEVEIP
ncbi:unnamed protein product [Clonostachys rosea f. rosea IK726]|uniref:Uncharacterized protein n=1 Tax=Clonostachys rosea f. rosea IK726 TaxID=1349383 RepID=A0ACA9U716_BIOOC|nr:unnamed protein product [Clonostachys rosea f. rosea IK726]